MKCKNCGGDYASKKLVCPYCGTENLLGKLWMAEQTEAEKELKKAREQKKLSKWTIYDSNRILSRAVFLTFLLIVVTTAFMMICIIASDLLQESKKAMGKAVDSQVLQNYYDTEQYSRMRVYLEKHKTKGVQEAQDYIRLTDELFYYSSFCEDVSRLKRKVTEYREESTEKNLEQIENYVKYILATSCRVFRQSREAKKDDSRNVAYPKTLETIENWAQEVKAFLIGTLELGPEEIRVLEETDYLEQETKDNYAKEIMGRRFWERWSF